MKEKVIFEGKKSFVPEGTHPKHGDGAMVLSFDRPDTELWTEENWLCADLRVDRKSVV